MWAVSSNSGGAAWTSNIDQGWNSYVIQQQRSQFNHILWINNQFVAVGFSRSGDLVEGATTWTSSNAFDSSSWTARYNLLGSSSSYLNQTASLGSNTVISVGAQLNSSMPLLLRSNDGAATWDRITLPASWRGPLHSVAHDAVSNRVWLGGTGWIATGVWADDVTTWQVIRVAQAKPVRTLLHHQGRVVATTLDQAWISSNGFDFDGLHQPGHSFVSSVVFEDSVILGVEGLLRTHTQFELVTSSHHHALQGSNSGTCALAMVVA